MLRVREDVHHLFRGGRGDHLIRLLLKPWKDFLGGSTPAELPLWPSCRRHLGTSPATQRMEIGQVCPLLEPYSAVNHPITGWRYGSVTDGEVSGIRRNGCKTLWERSGQGHWVAVVLTPRSGRVIGFVDSEKPRRISSLYLHRCTTNSVLDL